MRLNRRTKLTVWTRDKWRCLYCETKVADPLTVPQAAPHGATIDHVRPLSKGGRTAMNNLVTACFRCNQEKEDTMLENVVSPSPTLGDLWPS